MQAPRRGKIDIVVCFKLDRLGRSLSHLAQLIDEFSAHKVALVVPAQGIDTSEGNPAGNSVAQKRNRIDQETIERLPERYPMFLKTVIPFTVEVEKMGFQRMPVLAYGAKLPIAQAYSALCKEIQERWNALPP